MKEELKALKYSITIDSSDFVALQKDLNYQLHIKTLINPGIKTPAWFTTTLFITANACF